MKRARAPLSEDRVPPFRSVHQTTPAWIRESQWVSVCTFGAARAIMARDLTKQRIVALVAFFRRRRH